MIVRVNLILFAAVLILGACSTAPAPSAQGAESVPHYDLLELSFKHDGVYDNKFFDVQLEVVFTSPSGIPHRVDGFYYGGDLWKVRFRPDEPGHWTYAYQMMGKGSFRQEGKGAFDCTPSDEEGFVRRDPINPYRWVFSSGAPYFPIGLQDCVGSKGDQFNDMMIDGETRDTPSYRKISIDEYFSIYAQGGFNLFRFSQRNCSYQLFDDLDHYRLNEIRLTDDLLSLARKYGFRIMFGFFGFYKEGNTSDEQVIAKQERFIRYCVARWGAYVDFWELLNESGSSDEWASRMAQYVRSIDPDRKPISISDPKPNLSAIDINEPHWYESENELQSDLRVQQLATDWERAGKPVIVGEQGNKGMNWDPRSGLRMRIRSWTALFQEITLIFWNTSYAKNGMCNGVYTPGCVANIYLGPEERGYIRVLSDFSSKLDADMHMVSVEVSAPDRVRAYGLVSGTAAAVYLHHFESHTTAVNDLEITLDMPEANRSTSGLVGEWLDPSTGQVIARAQMSPGRHSLTVPSFSVDLALLVITAPNRSAP